MAKNKSKKKVETTVQGVVVPLKWNIPDNIITRFASNMAVQSLENEFRISFFEAYPEIILGENIEIPKEIRANCVASIIVAANKLPDFINVLQKQYDSYTKIKFQDKPDIP